MIKDNLVFLREFFVQFRETGTCFPTSRWAAKELSEPLSQPRGPRNILEVGPGTGPVTVEILRAMREEDVLYLCEINPRFMRALKENLYKNPDYLRHQDRIFFYEGPIQDLQTDLKFDVICCAIPFLNLDISTINEIFEKLKSLSNENTLMTYYEYLGLRLIGMLMSPPNRKQRMCEVDHFFKDFYKHHLLRRRRVWLNVLPINVYTLKLAA